MLLSVQQINKRYMLPNGLFRQHKQQVLENVSFNLKQGQSLGIIGRSGAGKSTLARFISGLESPDKGEILLHGQSIETARQQQKISMVFQDYTSSINPMMNVFDAIREPLRLRGIKTSVQKTNVMEYLSKVGLPTTLLNTAVHQLSGGQMQRVSICRALISRPDLIIFDEALSALDSVTQVQLLELLRTLKNEYQLSYLFITHNIQMVCYLCDSVLFLNNGKIVEQCAVNQLKYVSTDYAKKLLNAVIY